MGNMLHKQFTTYLATSANLIWKAPQFKNFSSCPYQQFDQSQCKPDQSNNKESSNKEKSMETVNLPVSLRIFDSNLRNSLAGILGNATFLEETPLTAAQRQMVKDILESGYAMLERINQFSAGAKNSNKYGFKYI